VSETTTVDESGGSNGLNRRDLLVKAGVIGAGAVAAGSVAGAAAGAVTTGVSWAPDPCDKAVAGTENTSREIRSARMGSWRSSV
jgi:hypothetical protein